MVGIFFFFWVERFLFQTERSAATCILRLYIADKQPRIIHTQLPFYYLLQQIIACQWSCPSREQAFGFKLSSFSQVLKTRPWVFIFSWNRKFSGSMHTRKLQPRSLPPRPLPFYCDPLLHCGLAKLSEPEPWLGVELNAKHSHLLYSQTTDCRLRSSFILYFCFIGLLSIKRIQTHCWDVCGMTV
jgi:hypothetical protein